MGIDINDGLTIRVSKLDAARRQLQTAITMWFREDDPVATHTLACAAYEVLHAVSKARDPNRPDLLFDSAHVPQEDRKELNDFLRAAANFFKHGDRDPHAVLEFSPGLTLAFLYYGIHGFLLCGEPLPKEFNIFIRWLQISHPEMLPEESQQKPAERVAIQRLAQFRTLPKHEFFDRSMRAMGA
jgi:hypothetical protein